MKLLPTVLVETTVLSYLVARRSKNEVYAARQTLTRVWWRKRHAFALFTSSTVQEECQYGDPREAKKRLAVAGTMVLLPLTDEAKDLAGYLVKRGALPPKALTDALHLAIATVSHIEYVASWNHKHMVNDDIQLQVYRIFSELGYTMPKIRTPDSLLEMTK